MPALNTFPLVLSIKEDGSIDSALSDFEANIRNTGNRAAAYFENAGKRASAAFRFDPAGAQQAATAARTAANAQAQVAAAAERVAASESGASGATRNFAAAQREAAKAAEATAVQLEEQAAIQNKVAAAAAAAGKRLATSSELVGRSMRGQSQSTLLAGAQLQDFFIQIQGGQNPLVAFSQQISQLGFVMQGSTGLAGKFATFMASGWGTAILAGVSILSILTESLFKNAEAAEAAKAGNSGLSDAQGSLGDIFDLTSGKIEHQNSLLTANARLTALNLQSEAQRQLQSARDARIATDNTAVGTLTAFFTRTAQNPFDRVRQLDAKGAEAQGYLDSIFNAPNDKSEQAAITKALKYSKDADFSGLGITREKFQQAVVDYASSQAKDKIAKLINESLDSGRLAPELRKPGHDNSSRVASLEEFGRDAADRVANLRAPFEEQPKLVQQTAKAMRELADITDDVTRKNAELIKLTGHGLPGYSKLLQDIKTAAEAIANAPVAKIDLQTRDLADQQRIQGLIAAGRPAEAQALEAKLQILRAIGVELGQEPADIAKALAGYEQQRQALIQTRAAAEAANTTRGIAQQNAFLQAQIAGSDDLAELLNEQFRIEQGIAQLGDEQLAKIKQQLDARHELTRELEEQRRLVDIEVQAANQLQDAFTNLFAGGKPKDLLNSVVGIERQKFAQELSVKIFGNLGAKTEDALTRSAGNLSQAAADSSSALTDAALQSRNDLGTAATQLSDSAGDLKSAAKTMADAVTSAAQAASGGPSLSQLATTPTAFGIGDTAYFARKAAVRALPRDPLGISGIGPIDQFAQDQSARTQVSLLKDQLNVQVQQFSLAKKNPLVSAEGLNTLVGIASGFVGGKAGNVLSAFLERNVIQGLAPTVAGGITKLLGGTFGAAGIGQIAGKALMGVGQGLFADSLVKLLGIKGSATGGALGGAAGFLIGGPLGGLIGGALGSIVGGLFKKKPKARSVLSVDDSTGELSYTTTGNKASARSASSSAADAVIQGLKQVADQLGGVIGGPLSTTIGVYKGKYRVNTTGSDVIGGLSGSEADNEKLGLYNFGKDGAEAAVQFAIQDAINDGVIKGVRDSTKRLLSAGKDFNAQLQKAVTFENVFKELKQYQDPVGAAIDDLNTQFDKLRQIFKEAGASTAEYSQLEQLYAFKRADAIKSATQDVSSSLQDLLDSLRYKDDTGLSLRTRQANALAAFNPLAATVRAGGVVDQDKFAEAARAVIDISRQLYGSTAKYFDQLNDITNLTAKAIANTGTPVTPITAALAQQAVPQAGAYATPAAVAAQAVGTPAAVNDNAALAASLAQSLAQQTDALKIPDDRVAKMTAIQLSQAVANSYTAISAKTGPDGKTTFSVSPMVDATKEQTKAMVGEIRALGQIVAGSVSKPSIITIAGAPSGSSGSTGVLQPKASGVKGVLALGSLRNG